MFAYLINFYASSLFFLLARLLTSTFPFIIKDFISKLMNSKSNRKSGLGKALRNKLEKKKVVDMGDRAPIFYQ
jgi:hypothetical protein